jgi:tetratricopeptide (TPR) repeat protein
MAKRKIDELRKQLTEPPGSYSLTGAEVPYFIEIGDATAAQSALARMDAVIKQNSWNYLASESAHGHGRLEELRGDCQRALQFYRETDRLEPTRTDINTDIGRCLRKLGRIKDAEAELMKTLRNMPAHGETNLELGLLYKDAGDAAKARAHLQRALRTWANADPNFKPARSAREALSALK